MTNVNYIASGICIKECIKIVHFINGVILALKDRKFKE